MKIKKTFFSILLSISLLLVTTFSCFATTEQNNPSVFPSDDALAFLEENGTTVSGDGMPLYDIGDKVIAYYYETSPTGYCIVDSFGNIIECAFDKRKEITDEKIYYLSPTVLCSKENNNYINIENNNVEKVNEKSNFGDTINEIAQKYKPTSKDATSNNVIKPILTNANYNKLEGTCRTYKYNPDGRCGSVASAILLMYYNDYIDDYMVLSSYETSDGVSLINLLVPHIEGNDPVNGSVTKEVVSGLNWYLRWKGRSEKYVAKSTTSISQSAYMSIINSGRPAIIDLNKAPTYGEHWVVGYGYDRYIRTDRTYFYYIVNDGWGSNSVLILSDYVGDAVYLNYL